MNNNLDSLSNQIVSQNVLNQTSTNYYTWSLSLLVLIILTYLIKISFDRNSSTISNHTYFSKLFYLFALATFLIISVIKVSLVLSLGLIGALSIVRFRTAIKEPEQIVYLFMLIAVSISAGAGQLIMATVITIVFSTFSHFTSSNNQKIDVNCDFCKIIFSSKLNKEKEIALNEFLVNNSEINKILRYTNDSDFTEITLSVTFTDLESFSKIKSKLNKIDEDIRVNYHSSLNI
jgi:uncharacterized membrane protein YhiD involved in acid resistance